MRDSYTVNMGAGRLPPELVLRIFTHLDYHSLVQCRLVNREIGAIASDTSILTSIPECFLGRYESTGITCTLSNYTKYLQIFTNTRVLEVPPYWSHETDEVNRIVGSWSSLVPLVHTLDINRGHTLDSATLTQLQIDLPHLRKFSLIKYHDTLDVSCLKVLYVKNMIPELSSNTLTHIRAYQVGSMRQLLKDCPKLVSVVISRHTLRESLTSSCLESLEVRQIDLDIDHAISACPSLYSLGFAVLPSTESNIPLKSERISTLTIRGSADLNLFMFPCLKKVSMQNARDPLYSESLREVYIDKVLPRHSRLPNVVRLSAQQCNGAIPPKVQHLTLKERDFTFIAESFSQCPELTVLDLRCTLVGTLSLNALVILRVDWFESRESFFSAASACPNLLDVYLLRSIPWRGLHSNAEEIWKSISCESLFADTSNCTGFSPKVHVPLSLTKKMPNSFRKLAIENRTGFYESDRHVYSVSQYTCL